jgi:hypothetical protein
MAGGAASWVCGVYFMFQTVAHRRPGVPLFPGPLQSPLNVLFQPDRLTERGCERGGYAC